MQAAVEADAAAFDALWAETEAALARAGGVPWEVDFAHHWARWEAAKVAMGAEHSLLRVPRARQCPDADLCVGVTTSGSCACYTNGAMADTNAVSYTHLRAHETGAYL
eukprot:9213232-Pyramimonas_sp.AAC.1